MVGGHNLFDRHSNSEVTKQSPLLVMKVADLGSHPATSSFNINSYPLQESKFIRSQSFTTWKALFSLMSILFQVNLYRKSIEQCVPQFPMSAKLLFLHPITHLFHRGLPVQHACPKILMDRFVRRIVDGLEVAGPIKLKNI